MPFVWRSVYNTDEIKSVIIVWRSLYNTNEIKSVILVMIIYYFVYYLSDRSCVLVESGVVAQRVQVLVRKVGIKPTPAIKVTQWGFS